jgi:hypothetical protein
MTQFVNDILNDFDAEFGIASDPSQQHTRSPSERSLPLPRSPPPSLTPRIDRSGSRLRPPPSSTSLHFNSHSQSSVTFTSPQLTSAKPSDSNAPPQSEPVGHLSVSEATQIINDLRKQRIRDASKMQKLQTENARLSARLAILEHTDLKVAELGSRLEQLLRKYLETEQIRTEQSAQISELRQEVIVLKAKLSDQESTQRRAGRSNKP